MNPLAGLAPYVHWGLRISLAATFLYHGLGKFPVAEFSQNFGMPLLVTWAVTIAEIIAGVCLIVGAFVHALLTRLAGLIVIVIAIGAIVLVHWQNGFSVMSGGYEFHLLMIAAGLYFAARGNDV